MRMPLAFRSETQARAGPGAVAVGCQPRPAPARLRGVRRRRLRDFQVWSCTAAVTFIVQNLDQHPLIAISVASSSSSWVEADMVGPHGPSGINVQSEFCIAEVRAATIADFFSANG